MVGRSEQYGAHIVFFKVHHNGLDAVFELQQFVGFGIEQSVDAHHTVAHLKHGTHLFELKGGIDFLELLKQDFGNFTGSYIF